MRKGRGVGEAGQGREVGGRVLFCFVDWVAEGQVGRSRGCLPLLRDVDGSVGLRSRVDGYSIDWVAKGQVGGSRGLPSPTEGC